MLFKHYKSPNFNDRVEVDGPSMIILHYTGMKSEEAAIKHLCDRQSKVSAHYIVMASGKIQQLVDDKKRAWHAGVSHWAGIEDVNSHSIGIEIVNRGHEFGYEKFPNFQIDEIIELCQTLKMKHSISNDLILGHSDVAPRRKFDPGHLFPWEKLASKNIGLWPRPVEMDYQAAEDLLLNGVKVHELLVAYGYDPNLPFRDVLTAFMRHFHPEKFKDYLDHPEPDVLTIARLLALVRAKHEQ